MSGISIPRARGPMIKDAPDHHDADLVLRLYDLRRESKMREARAFMAGEFWPAGAEEAVALAKHDHPKNALYRQFFGYWEMAYGMARHGIVNPDLRLHTVDNLYAAGCAVFPTGGFANPALTLIALALRLADHLKARP